MWIFFIGTPVVNFLAFFITPRIPHLPPLQIGRTYKVLPTHTYTYAWCTYTAIPTLQINLMKNQNCQKCFSISKQTYAWAVLDFESFSVELHPHSDRGCVNSFSVVTLSAVLSRRWPYYAPERGRGRCCRWSASQSRCWCWHGESCRASSWDPWVAGSDHLPPPTPRLGHTSSLTCN